MYCRIGSKQPTLTKPPTPTKPPTRTPVPPTATRTPRPPTPQPTKEGLSAGVRHNISHEQMIITNNNKYAWNDVTMEMNSGILTRGYAYKIRRVEPGVTLTISVLEFTKSDGTRFNPFATKILNFSINCDEGYWYSER